MKKFEYGCILDDTIYLLLCFLRYDNSNVVTLENVFNFENSKLKYLGVGREERSREQGENVNRLV